MAPRFAPNGVASDAQLATDMDQLLRRQADDAATALDYRFHVTLPSTLRKGQVVRARGTGRQGTVADAPPLYDPLQPLSRHPLAIHWDDAATTNPETVAASTLTASSIKPEHALSTRLRALAKTGAPFRASLDGTLLTVDGRAHDVLHEVHTAMRTLYGDAAVGPIESPSLADEARKVRFYRTRKAAPGDVEAQALADPAHARVQDARTRRRATVTNRKHFAQTQRADPWWNQYTDENVATTQRRKRLALASRKRGARSAPSASPPPVPCNAKQPRDVVGHDVVVPALDASEVVTTYVRAKAVGVEQSPEGPYWLMRVTQGPREWTVALPHVHPVDTCQEVRRGSAVFVTTTTTTSGDGDGDGPTTYTVGHIERILHPTDTLVCGFAGDAPRRVRAPTHCTADAWTAALVEAFPEAGLQVQMDGARVRIRSASRARFCVTAASTAAGLLGFVAGRTYEAKHWVAEGCYVLDAPHDLDRKGYKVRTAPHLVVRGLGATSTHPLADVIPVRPQYSRERETYAHPSAYQRFPVAFLTRERPQRGMLLYHEMGAGKSRTAIEMAQRDLEDRYWAHRDEHRARATTTAAAAAPTSSTPWWGARPPVVLFSPTQEARTHFLRSEVPQWSGCWWSTTASGEWVPRQHVYTRRAPAALYAEMAAHERAVGDTLWSDARAPHTNVYLAIVLDNTNNLYRILHHVEGAVTNKSIPSGDKKEVARYFGALPGASTFDIQTRTHPDEYYGRFFKGAFVIVDEIHRLCNAMVNSEGAAAQGRVGDFFYKALMEAPHCRVVGLSGTPMQRTATAFAPLFNVLHGKTTVWTVGFTAGTSAQLKEDTYASIRPLASTIWTDHRQPVDHGDPRHHAYEAVVQFTPWPGADVAQAVDALVKALRSHARIEVPTPPREYELFPFAFRQTRGHGKVYQVDTSAFAERFIKHNRLKHPVDFAKRVVGMVSYVSPPKVTARDDPTLSGGAVYPQHAIRTCRLAMGPSHHAYLTAIQTRKRAINQRQADGEERSGCNVNWGAVRDRTVLDGKDGLLKLFFKGGADGQALSPAALDAAYHTLLAKVHALCAARDPRIAAYLRVGERLADFSPKMQRIVQSLRANYRHKAVVYSEFVDGVGGTADLEAVPADARRRLDTGHIGFSGLGVLGYVLEANGYVRFELRATHVFEAVHALVHRTPADARQIVRACGTDRRTPLTAAHVVDACRALGLDLATDHAEVVEQLSTDVTWDQMTVSVREFGRWLAAEAYGPHAKWLAATRTRYALSEATREGLGLHKDAAAPA